MRKRCSTCEVRLQLCLTNANIDATKQHRVGTTRRWRKYRTSQEPEQAQSGPLAPGPLTHTHAVSSDSDENVRLSGYMAVSRFMMLFGRFTLIGCYATNGDVVMSRIYYSINARAP